MSRFITIGRDDLKNYNDPEGYDEWMNEWDYPTFLVDTATNTVVFCDSTEPEDATLDRSFSPLVDLLNAVAAEKGGDD